MLIVCIEQAQTFPEHCTVIVGSLEVDVPHNLKDVNYFEQFGANIKYNSDGN